MNDPRITFAALLETLRHLEIEIRKVDRDYDIWVEFFDFLDHARNQMQKPWKLAKHLP